MKVHIGKYIIESNDGFNSSKDAIEFIRNRFPELSEEEVKPYVKPLIKKNEFNKSGDTAKKNTKGKEGSSELSNESTEG